MGERCSDLTQTYEDPVTATRESCDDRSREAFDMLDLTLRMIEDEGRELSKGDIADKEDRPKRGSRSPDDDRSRARGRTRGDDDERPFKPPTPPASLHA